MRLGGLRLLRLVLAVGVKVYLGVGLDGRRWVQCAILHLYASLSATFLANLGPIVLKAEEEWHVVSCDCLLASTTCVHLMHHLNCLQVANFTHGNCTTSQLYRLHLLRLRLGRRGLFHTYQD